ncbi:hypothetical protein FCULG_00010245 [Fusarium culmorum]|uniref:Uncharacterized protein n=1 Tax=Fusarium culmorum TaxID=5516 RepID=A0A2T4GDK0_FUSCU|nr:hypothetical protein FCULG_00010245 [Fusarium culmorum]
MAVSNPLVGSVPLYAGLGFTESTPSVTHPEHHVKVPAYRSGTTTTRRRRIRWLIAEEEEEEEEWFKRWLVAEEGGEDRMV